ncbi:hypothetical protein A5893_07115 [Pedobacter psychrophilus]|uniref:AsmA-like C-terminal domain-containing protein n=1 Tax=Pedobacter psychrophilus TaxID=1826909 RepID=A0A179DIJ2_9SPHI|nr:hypothetical protein [Pedobacter psychrophilus]OAQ40704.1 hypothetical protein A5893_07115 [Pedobacter psychrophilus]
MKKFLLWFTSIVLVLAIALYIGSKYLQKNWKPLLEEQLKKAVINSTDSLYKIEYKNIDVNPLNGNLKLVDFKLIPVMSIYQKLKDAKKAPDNLYELSVDALVIRNANAKEAVKTKKLNIANIIINHPQLKIINDRQSYNDTVKTSNKERKNPYELIKDIFKELKINTIKLQEIDFTFVNKSYKTEKKTSLKNLNIEITDLLIDSLSSQDSSRVYYTKNVLIDIKDYKIATPDSLYFVKMNNLSFSTLKNELQLKDVKLEPRLDKVPFYKKVGYAKDRFDLDFKNITIQDIDFDLFLKQQRLFAQTLSIDKARVDVYNNNAYPKHRSDKTGKFPHQQLLKLALDMRIAKLNLNNVAISYSEFDAKSKKTGRIDFKNVNGTIYNVTNDSASLSKNSVMKANLKTQVFGVIPADLNFKFYMLSKVGAFDFGGVIGAFNGKAVNEIVKPLGMAEIKSANIKKMIFNATANQNKANGTVKFYYDDLSVNILTREDNGNLKSMGFASSLANRFIINTQNPSKKGVFTTGRIYYQRPTYASFFNYLWQSLFTGIKESVGVSREKEEKLRNTAERIGGIVSGTKEAFSSVKEALKERKEKRQLKREEKKKQKELEKQE